MKNSFILLILLIGACVAKKKSNLPVAAYFNKAWMPVNGPTEATFYRTVEKKDGEFLVHDYYMSGSLQMEILCTNVTPKLIWEGNSILYHENGAMQEEGMFKNQDRYGLHEYWYKNGARKKEIMFKNKRQLYCQFWSPSGQPLLRHGTGIVHDTSEEANFTMDIKDSIVRATYLIDPAVNDTVYIVVDKKPEYAGGMQALARDTKPSLKCSPDESKMVTDGIVFVQFIIDKNGDIKNSKVFRSLSSACDAAALQTVSRLGRWNPGIYHGRPVQVKYLLPISFGSAP